MSDEDQHLVAFGTIQHAPAGLNCLLHMQIDRGGPVWTLGVQGIATPLEPISTWNLANSMQGFAISSSDSGQHTSV